MDSQITLSRVTLWTDVFLLHWTAQMGHVFLRSGSQVNAWHMELPSCLPWGERKKVKSRHHGLANKSRVAETNQKVPKVLTAPCHPWKYSLCCLIWTIRGGSRDMSVARCSYSKDGSTKTKVHPALWLYMNYTNTISTPFPFPKMWIANVKEEDLWGQMGTAVFTGVEKEVYTET